MSQTCFHCGQPVPPGVDFPIQDRDTQHAACCAGCQAVAQTIIDTQTAEIATMQELLAQL